MPSLSASADAFFRALNPADRARVARARAIFLLNSATNLLLYYGGASPDGHTYAKFPATISWTVRRGLPQAINLLLWACGWWNMLRVFARRGDRMANLFAAQMFVTGISALWVFPIGVGPRVDAAHIAAASMYFVDHIFLFRFFRTAHRYRVWFYTSFASLLVALGRVRAIEKRYGFKAEPSVAGAAVPNDSGGLGRADDDGENPGWATAESAVQAAAGQGGGKANMSSETRRRLWWNELAVMVSENSVFVAFVAGMTSGFANVSKSIYQ